MAKRPSNSNKTPRLARRFAETPMAIAISTKKRSFLIEIDAEPKIVAPEFEGGKVVGGTAAEKAIEKMKDVGAAIAEVCGSIHEEVKSALEKAVPNELTLEFGIKLTGETGVPMITKVSAEGSLKVTVKWNLK